MSATGPGRTLWVDVSMLYGKRGNATGITRTLSQLLRHWQAEESLPICLYRYDRLRKSYYAVSPQELTPQRPKSSSSRASAAAPSSSGWTCWLPNDLREAGWHLQRAAIHAGRLVRGVFRRAQKLLYYRPRFLRGAIATAPFAPGDAVLLAGVNWEDRADYHQMGALRQELGLRVIQIIYDITALRCPHWCASTLTAAVSNWLPHIVHASDLLLSISDCTRRDLLTYGRQNGLSIPPVEVIRLGDEPGDDDTEEAPGLPAWLTGPFAMFVSSIALHKNQTLLFHVWHRLVERHGDKVPPLVLVGQPSWRSSEILRELKADALLSSRVVHLANVNDRQLRWLYRRCLFTLYPSHYEGWGLPVAESLIHGKYCICSIASSLPEVGGYLADYHDPLDAPTCQSLIERALFDPSWLANREARIRREYRITSWKDCAAQIMRIIDRHLALQETRAAA